MAIWTGLASWMLGTLSLTLPGGYSIPLVMLALLLPVCFLSWSRSWNPRLSSPVVVLVPAGCLMLFALIWLVVADWHGETSSAMKLVWPAFLATPCLLVLMMFPPSQVWLWLGLAMGGMSCGGLSLVQRWVMGYARAFGPDPLHPILFGNFSLLMSCFCLAGLGWAWIQPRRRLWISLLLSGAAGGLLASILSGTRGGWVIWPGLLLVLFLVYGDLVSRRFCAWVVLGMVVLACLAVWIPQTGVKARLDLGIEHVSRYLSGERGVETGARVEIWRGATQLVVEQPLLGWGDTHYHRELARLGEKGLVDPGVANYWHAHSDLLDAWVRRGVGGFLALLMVYALPLVAFLSGIRDTDLGRRSLVACGLLLGVGLFGFGLSYSFMVYPVGIALYTSWLCLFWGLYQVRLRVGHPLPAVVDSRGGRRAPDLPRPPPRVY